MNRSLYNLFLKMFKIGLIGFGGGTALIPIIYQETVEDGRLKIKKAEYDKYVLLASITPGALPVEISALIGYKFWGILGSLSCAAMMALPGVILTLLILIFISSNFGEYRQLFNVLQVGISAYIIVMLSDYLKKFITNISSSKLRTLYILLVLLIFLITSEKRIISLLDFSESRWRFSITLADIVGGLFIFLCVNSLKNSKRTQITASLCTILYAISLFAYSFNPEMFKIIKIILFVFAVSITLKKINSNKHEYHSFKSNLKGIHEILKNIISCICLLIIGLIPLMSDIQMAYNFMTSSLFSSIVSFGGGDAFLSVADAVFIETSILPSDTFYGLIVPVVNMLPGSILCKTLTAIGYCLIPQASIFESLSMALLGFICSLVGSCSIVLISKTIYERFENLSVFIVINRSVSIIICGLILSVIFSIIVHDVNAIKQFSNSISTKQRLLDIILITAPVFIFHNYFKIRGFNLIIFSLAITSVIINIA